MENKLKLYGFNNLTKALSFNIYDVCYAKTEREQRDYIKYIDQQYNSERLTGIMEKLTEQIVSGQLAAGEKVPPVRELAAQAGVNPNTMQRALAEMEREGLMFTNRTSGRYVTEDREMIGKVREQIAGERITEFLSGMSQLGFTEQDIVALLEKRSGEEKKNG